jgi:hypothetical protein
MGKYTKETYIIRRAAAVSKFLYNCMAVYKKYKPIVAEIIAKMYPPKW